MYKWLRNLNFSALIILIVLEISTIVLYSVIFINTFKHEEQPDEKDNSYFYLNSLISIFSIALSCFSLWLVIQYGIHSLYFKIISRLKWYLAGSIGIIIALCIIFAFEYTFENELKDKRATEIISITEIIDNSYYIIISKIILYLLTSIFTCHERSIMTKEIEASPLISVDENLTEELYKNIIQQSKNPEDNELVKQYNKISDEIKEKRRKTLQDNEASSSRNNMTLEENSTSDIFNQRVLDSINSNSERRSDLTADYGDISRPLLKNSGFRSPVVKD